MRLRTIGTVVVLTCILFSVNVWAQGDLTDPYDVLNRYFAARGGLDKLKAEQSQYFEGELAVAGLTGSIKVWTQLPHRSRAEVDLGVISMTQGDNGEYTWALDANGKIQKMTNLDEATLNRRDVQTRIAAYEYTEPGSEFFAVSLTGVDTVGEKLCYVVRIANSINDDIYTFFIDTEDFQLAKSLIKEAEYDRETLYSDYREIDGLLVAFHTVETTYPVRQTQEITISRYESNPPIDQALFEPPEEETKDYEFLNGSSAEDIPFEFIGNHLYIPVTVAGKERLWVLDTGAGMTVIPKEFAEELGLNLEGNMAGQGAGGTVEASFTELPPFSMQGIKFDKQTVAVIDIQELTYRLGVDIAGILGFDFLSRFVTKVDYANQLVSFYDPETFAYSGDGRAIDAHIENSVIEVPGVLDGKHAGNWLFDLGAGSTGLDAAYALANGFTDRPGVERLAHGAENEFKVKRVASETFEFAGYTIDNPIVSFPVGGTDSVFRAERLGILGNDIYRNFVLYIDYAREQIIVEPGAEFNGDFPIDRSGLQLMRGDGGDIVVLFVADGTPAAKAGFREGDVVSAINGIGVEHLDGVIAIREMLKGKPGTKLTFSVTREGKAKDLTLVLAKLL